MCYVEYEWVVLHTWHDSCVCNMTRAYMIWLIHMCYMPHSHEVRRRLRNYICIKDVEIRTNHFTHVTRLMHMWHDFFMTYSHMTCLVHMCDMPHSFVVCQRSRNDFCMNELCHMWMCHVEYEWVVSHTRHDSYIRDITRAYVTCLIRMWYRVAKTHRMPYFYRSLFAKEPYNSGSFAKDDLQRHPMCLRHPVPHTNEACYICTSHVTYVWVVSRMWNHSFVFDITHSHVTQFIHTEIIARTCFKYPPSTCEWGMSHIYMSHVTYAWVASRVERLIQMSRCTYVTRPMHTFIWVIWRMEWLRSVGSMKLQVSFQEYRLFYRAFYERDL